MQKIETYELFKPLHRNTEQVKMNITIMYEVQAEQGNTFENCWHVDDELQYFQTRADAEAELDDALATIIDAHDRGFTSSSSERDEYRVVPVALCPVCKTVEPMFKYDAVTGVCHSCGNHHTVTNREDFTI